MDATHTSDAAPLETWAVLELMGHRQAIGRVTETTIAGRQMIRVERVDTEPEGVEQFYGPESVSCLTPVTEDQARRIASRHYRTHIVPPALTAGDDLDDDEDAEEWAREMAAEGMETAMSASERAEYDRDLEFALDAADEARDLAAEDGDYDDCEPTL